MSVDNSLPLTAITGEFGRAGRQRANRPSSGRNVVDRTATERALDNPAASDDCPPQFGPSAALDNRGHQRDRPTSTT
jgi:hypothetical protein